MEGRVRDGSRGQGQRDFDAQGRNSPTSNYFFENSFVLEVGIFTAQRPSSPHRRDSAFKSPHAEDPQASSTFPKGVRRVHSCLRPWGAGLLHRSLVGCTFWCTD